MFDPSKNPADILMDILSDKGVNMKEHISPNDLVEKWENSGRTWVENNKLEDLDHDTGAKLTGSELDSEVNKIVKQRGASIPLQIGLCHNRYIIQQYRRVWALALEIGVATLAGGLVFNILLYGYIKLI